MGVHRHSNSRRNFHSTNLNARMSSAHAHALHSNLMNAGARAGARVRVSETPLLFDDPAPRVCARAVDRARYIALPSGGARGMALVGMFEAIRTLSGIEFGADMVEVEAESEAETETQTEGEAELQAETKAKAERQQQQHVAKATERRLKGASGTSIGALFALLLVLGFTSAEMRALLEALTMYDVALPNPILMFTRACGADDGAMLKATISAAIRRKLGVPDVTLLELARRCGGTQLATVVADTTTASVRYLRADTEPLMSATLAVYASMALPPLYSPIEYDGHVLQDGGGLDALPVGAWAHVPGAQSCTLSAVLHCAAPPLSPASASASASSSSSSAAPSSSLPAYLARSLYCATYPAVVAQWCLLDPAARAACIVLDTSETSVFEMDLSPTVKERARAKGFQDTAATLFRMAANAPPQRPAQRFAQREGLPPYLHALIEKAETADRMHAVYSACEEGLHLASASASASSASSMHRA